MSIAVTELNLACCAVEAGEGVDLWRVTAANRAAAESNTAESNTSESNSVEPDLNVLVVAGTVTKANAALVRSSYEALPEPRVVIAFGVCTISGGPYWDSYSVLPGIADLVPVDLMVPGCPPQPEDVVAALNTLAAREVNR